MALTNKLTAIGDAIREKTGGSSLLTLDEMPSAIASVETGSSDVPFEYGGMNAVHVAHYTANWTLADTSFVIGSSASTSATTIKAAVSNMFTTPDSPTYAYGDKDIVVVQRVYAIPTHSSTSTKKAEQIRYAAELISWFSKRKTTDTSAKTTRQQYSANTYINKYYNASGVVTRATAQYGFYIVPQGPTIASSTSASSYVRCSSPTLNYRASSSYETTANIKLVTECEYKWVVDVYAVDSRSTVVATANDDLDDILLNGLE